MFFWQKKGECNENLTIGVNAYRVYLINKQTERARYSKD